MSLQQDFLDDGYVVLDHVLPHDLIDRHMAAAAALYERLGASHNVKVSTWAPGRETAFHDEVNAFHCNDPTALQLSLHPSLTGPIEDIFGDTPVRHFMRTMFWHDGSRQPHFDTSAISTWPDFRVTRAWCAMDDIDPDCGIFFLVPGSHNLRHQWMDELFDDMPELVVALDALAAREEGAWARYHALCWPHLSQKVADATAGMPRVTFSLRKGDVVLFSPNVTHGTMPRRDPYLPRKALINEYRARSARLYFCSERFGTRRRIDDERFSLPGDHGAMATPWGLVNPSFDWNFQAIVPARL